MANPKDDKPKVEIADNTQDNLEVDFDKMPTMVDGMQEMMRKFMQRQNTNSVEIAGDARSTYLGDPKQKMTKGEDGNWNVPVFDDAGQPVLKDPFRSVTIAFNGGEMSIPLNKEMFESISIGRRYLFIGVKGMNYGSVQDIFHDMVEL